VLLPVRRYIWMRMRALVYTLQQHDLQSRGAGATEEGKKGNALTARSDWKAKGYQLEQSGQEEDTQQEEVGGAGGNGPSATLPEDAVPERPGSSRLFLWLCACVSAEVRAGRTRALAHRAALSSSTDSLKASSARTPRSSPAHASSLP